MLEPGRINSILSLLVRVRHSSSIEYFFTLTFFLSVFQHLSPAQKKDSISRFFSSCKFDLTVRKDETPELIPKFKTTVKSVVSAIHGDSGFNSYFQVFNLVNELVLKTGMRSVRDELRKLFHYLFTEASTPKHFIGEGGEKEMNCFLDELLKIFDGKTDKREAIPEMSREAANILKQIDEYSKETEKPNLFSKFPK